MMEKRAITICFRSANAKIVHGWIDSIQTDEGRAHRKNWCKADRSTHTPGWMNKETQRNGEREKKHNRSQNHIYSRQQQCSRCHKLHLNDLTVRVRTVRRVRKLERSRKQRSIIYMRRSMNTNGRKMQERFARRRLLRCHRRCRSSSHSGHTNQYIIFCYAISFPSLLFFHSSTRSVVHVFYANVDLSMRINRKRANSRFRKKKKYLYKHSSLCLCQECECAAAAP